MKKIMIGLVILIFGIVMLVGLVGCSGIVIPSESNNVAPFVGLWVNENSNDPSITKILIYFVETMNIIQVREWGKCYPTDCDWGAMTIHASDAFDGVLDIIWIFDFAQKTQEIILLPNGRLQVITFTHFTDDSGRIDYEETEYFTRTILKTE